MRKGGYKLIDMNGFDFATTPSSPNIDIYNNLNTNFNKVLLISNWYVNGVLMNDVFTTLISNDNSYQFNIHTEDTDYTYSINNTGAITLTTKSNHLYLYRFVVTSSNTPYAKSYFTIITTYNDIEGIYPVNVIKFLTAHFSGQNFPLFSSLYPFSQLMHDNNNYTILYSIAVNEDSVDLSIDRYISSNGTFISSSITGTITNGFTSGYSINLDYQEQIY